jgi:hypothetical protein
MENLLCFWCLENLPVPHIERLLTTKFIVNYPLLVLLVVSFPTKLVSSHSEFPCKSYLSFLVPGKRLSSAVNPAQERNLDQTIWRSMNLCSGWVFGVGTNLPAGRRTIRPAVRRRRTYGRTSSRAASNGQIFTHL